MKHLVLHTPEAGEWTVAELDGIKIYEGHDWCNQLMSTVLTHLEVQVTTFEYEDSKFEESLYE